MNLFSPIDDMRRLLQMRYTQISQILEIFHIRVWTLLDMCVIQEETDLCQYKNVQFALILHKKSRGIKFLWIFMK